MLRQLKDFCKFFANPNFLRCYNQLQRRHVRHRHPVEVVLEKNMAEVSMKRHGCAKQLVVFFGAASIGTAGPTQQPGCHTASSLRARAQHSPSSQAQQAGS
ncbi:hypothetical protein HaLaN_03765 [Haematococcus lacustris]|uniref:Uncharacterized protein n=1 Tax=Haematococcus lacustris TaxID=44745 RepID=A0A699YF84_HAELA|nr:hypothetical protein HaLaN_03765 [Haematococcus lacustris]